MAESCFYVFDSHSKDENGNISAVGTTILLKLESLSSLKNYILSVYYANYLMTLSFKIQFIRVSYTLHARNKIRNSIKNRRKNSVTKWKYYANLEPQKKYKEREFKKNLN